MVEDLIQFGIEDHTSGPTNVREHFPEEELTPSENMKFSGWANFTS